MKLFFTILLAFPTLLIAQKANTWQVFIDKKLYKSGCAAGMQKITINKNAEVIELKYKPTKAKINWFTKVVIMDTNRVELDSKLLTSKNSYILNPILFKDEQGNKRPLNVYILQTPKDEKLAALVRVAPRQILRLSLSN